MSADRSPHSTRFVGQSGVAIRVRTAPVAAPPPPTAPAQPPRQGGRVVVRPPPSPHAARDAFIRRIVEKHGTFLLRKLQRPGVNPASAEELRQELYIVLGQWFDENGEPENDEAVLTTMAVNQLRNRSRRRRVPVDDGAEADQAAAPAPDPERALVLARRRDQYKKYVARLSTVERVVLEYDLDGLTTDQMAEKLDRARGTVSTQLRRAWTKLQGFADEDEQAEEARLQRKAK